MPEPIKDEDIFEKERISIPLTPENAAFTRSSGGLVSLNLAKCLSPDGQDIEAEYFERVVLMRCYPITNPDEFISVREPDSKKMGRGKEIGMIRRMSMFPQEVQDLINEELARRYFQPEITKIHSVKEKFGYTYWDAETTAGHITFIMNNPFSNIRALEDGRIFIADIDGNSFTVHDPAKLDPVSYRKLEVYL